MKKVILLLTAVFFVVLISSCSDDKSTSPEPTQSTGLPLATGNWWKYSSYESDGDGNPKGDVTSSYTNSIGTKTTLDGKTAYEMISDEGGEGGEKSFISTDANGVYSYNSPVVDEKGNVTPGSWWKIIDFKNSNWDIYSEVVNEEGEGYKRSGTNTMKGVKKGTSIVTYKGKENIATTYFTILSSDITTQTLVDEEWVTKQEVTSDTITYVFIGGIGFFSTETFNLFGIPVLGRSIDILVDHKVN